MGESRRERLGHHNNVTKEWKNAEVNVHNNSRSVGASPEHDVHGLHLFISFSPHSDSPQFSTLVHHLLVFPNKPQVLYKRTRRDDAYTH